MQIWVLLKKYFGSSGRNSSASLGLYGDGDDIEILEVVEKALGISFTDEEARSVKNVGDFFDLTIRKTDENSPNWDEFKCMIAPSGTLDAAKITRETEFFRNA